ncbi:MAG: DUF554 family protein, partial [Pygmaiobacter sp.]
LLLFGELDVSVLDELPPGRQPVKTYAVSSALRGRMFGFIERQIAAGRQAFIVCPLIEEGDGESSASHEMQAVTTYAEEVARALLPQRRIGLLHGRLKAVEKAEVMRAFAAGELDVLCATTVIEVGVDVPNASVMVIENAERYGLSALHQLRGRVGRGAQESYCILVSDHDTEEVRSRLALLCHTNDGFEVAQYDLEHRGPGDFFGERQHGLPTLKVADAIQDARVIETAANEAAALLARDPQLTTICHARLRSEVEALFEASGGLAINCIRSWKRDDFVLVGTLVNAAAIVAGGLLGLLLKKGMKPNYEIAINKTLGVAVLILGLNGVIGAMFRVGEGGRISSSGELLLIVSLVVGTFLGELLGIDAHLARFGARIETKVGSSGFGAALVNGTLIYCVGAMAIVGALNDGLRGDSSVLLIKSMLDGISSVVLGATLGVGVCFSALPVLLYQGSISLLSGVIAPYLQGALLDQLCMVGFAMVACIGMNFISDNVKIKTANMLPGLLVPVVWTLLKTWIGF